MKLTITKCVIGTLGVLFVLFALALASSRVDAEEVPADCGAYAEQAPAEIEACGSGEKPDDLVEANKDGICPIEGMISEAPGGMCWWPEDEAGGSESGEIPEVAENSVDDAIDVEDSISDEDESEASAEADVETEALDANSEPLGHDVHGTMYVTGTGGEGLHCRAEPSSTSTIVKTLADGEPVGWVSDGNSLDEWIGTEYGCYVHHGYLSTTAPVADTDKSQVADDLPAEATDSQELLTEAPPVEESQQQLTEIPPTVESQGTTAEASLVVTTLPKTGHGTAAQIKGVDNSKLSGDEGSMLTDEQRRVALFAVAALLFAVPIGVALSPRRHSGKS